MDFSVQKHQSRWKEVQDSIKDIINKLEEMSAESIGRYLDFNTLNQTINAPSSKVGEFERNLFKKSFSVLIDVNSELEKMTPCWRAGI
jgi:hypothetical protein